MANPCSTRAAPRSTPSALANRNRTVITIVRLRYAAHLLILHQSCQRVTGHLPARIFHTGRILAGLVALGCINTEEPNADVEVVAIARTCSALYIAGLRSGTPGEKRSERDKAHEKRPFPWSLERSGRRPQARSQALATYSLIL